ncbi:t-SNARE domain-containing protein [Rozella allomycis CSF55]|uniref:t-SNARE domain-containing protein n=1 Tax=Rozella allomycis (strain CSF55) TaxID=988480 RepID=A0A075AWE0_ROZAC|nr:t-SNARE domain-containing protein [Rozella allomycis CSF55]|eukprot:EPZ33027.1 t-SNARE domain-containing protein [Rozella allomycis CSF55]
MSFSNYTKKKENKNNEFSIEIQDSSFKILSDSISSAIFQMSNNIAAIQKIATLFGTPRDNQQIRQKLHHLTETTSHIARKAGEDMKKLNAAHFDQPEKERNGRIQQNKLSKDLQAVLKRFQQVEREAAEKSREYIVRAKAATEALESQARHDSEDIQEKESLINDYERREEGIQEIETAILQVNEIFRDLGTLVNEQQSLIDNIESNIETTATRTQNAAKCEEKEVFPSSNCSGGLCYTGGCATKDPCSLFVAWTSLSSMTETSTAPASSVPQPKLDIQYVCYKFVKNFYTMMSNEPERLHHFYDKNSSMTVGLDGDLDRKEICSYYESAGLQGCVVAVSSITWQPSAANGIILVVVGRMDCRGKLNNFTQTFFLAEQPNGYYVLNDILVYLQNAGIQTSASKSLTVEQAVQHAVEEEKPVQNEDLDLCIPSMPAADEDDKYTEIDSMVPEPSETRPESVTEESPEDPSLPEPIIEEDENVLVESVQNLTVEDKESEPVVHMKDQKKPSSWAKLAAHETNKWGGHSSSAKGYSTHAEEEVKENTPPRKFRRDFHNKENREYKEPQHRFMIYIGNVPKETTYEELKDIFNEISPVKRVELTKNYAVIHYDTVEDAKKAVGHKFTLHGRDFVSEERRPRPTQQNNTYRRYNYNNNRRKSINRVEEKKPKTQTVE